ILVHAHVIIVIDAVVDRALTTIGGRYAAHLQHSYSCSRTIRVIRNNEVSERRLADENEALRHDKRLESSAGVDSGIHTGRRSRGEWGESNSQGSREKRVAHVLSPDRTARGGRGIRRRLQNKLGILVS